MEKIWETPSLGKERASEGWGEVVKDGVVTVRYVGKYVDGRERERARAPLCSYARQASKRKG